MKAVISEAFLTQSGVKRNMFRDQLRVATITVCAWLSLTFSANCHAVDKAQVLPKRVNYASVRFGVMDKLGEVYGASGGIGLRGDAFSQSFDMNKIRKFATPEIKTELDRLTKTLNTFGNSEIANQLNLGTLQFDVDPTVRYTAPIYARGITERFTLGLALPVINYKAQINVAQVGSNVPQIKRELQAVTANSEELARGLNRLDESLVTTFNQIVQDRGYKPIRSREESFLGDIQMVGLYHLVKQSRENAVLKVGLVLPTGPEDDPDDLTDLNNQHQFAVGAGVINDYSFISRWTIGSGVYFLSRIPDRSTRRVPESEEDSLPKANRKERLDRDLGDSLSANANIRYQFNDYFEATAGFETGTKSPDQYSGQKGWDYALLSKNTYQTWNKTLFALEYSTVAGFIGGRDPIPFTVSYDFSDIFAGTNIERQQMHELGIKLYF